MLTQKGPSVSFCSLCVFWAFLDCFHLEVQNEKGEREAGGGEGKSQADELGRKTLPVVSPPEPLPSLFTPSPQLPQGAESRPLLQRSLQQPPRAQRALPQGAALGGPGAGEMPAASRFHRDQGEGGALDRGARGGLSGSWGAAGAHSGGVEAGECGQVPLART